MTSGVLCLVSAISRPWWSWETADSYQVTGPIFVKFWCPVIFFCSWSKKYLGKMVQKQKGRNNCYTSAAIFCSRYPPRIPCSLCLMLGFETLFEHAFAGLLNGLYRLEQISSLLSIEVTAENCHFFLFLWDCKHFFTNIFLLTLLVACCNPCKTLITSICYCGVLAFMQWDSCWPVTILFV